MSEPIQSIAQNNYILATQQEVSHDNSLSGNGTVESPLGVVPGYNETVLWSGELKYGDNNVPLTEAITNFERIRIVTSTGIIQEYYTANLTQYFTLTTSFYDAISNYVKHVAVALRIYNSNLYYQYNRVNQSSSYWNNVNDTSTWIVKVIGINRKA